MPKCPKCGAELVSLKWEYEATFESELSLDKKGNPDYSDAESNGDGYNDEYSCWECGEVLFTTEKEAVAFLQGKD